MYFKQWGVPNSTENIAFMSTLISYENRGIPNATQDVVLGYLNTRCVLSTSPQDVYILGLMDVFWVNGWTSWKHCLENALSTNPQDV